MSACLLGKGCRYDGRHNEDEPLRRELLARDETAVPFCPEEEGGLGTPRPPAWIEGGAAAVVDGAGRVVTEDGVDVTDGFLSGARKALDTCRAHGIDRAYLKERSPSCGCAHVHTSGGLVRGCGVTTAMLRRAGVAVVSVA